MHTKFEKKNISEFLLLYSVLVPGKTKDIGGSIKIVKQKNIL